MPAFRRDPGRLQSRRAAAHHQDLARRVGPGEPVPAPLELATRGRIDEAADPVVARAPSPAHLVARQAWPHVVGPPFARLVRHVRIRDLAAHDAHHVRLSGGDDVVRVLRGADVALRLHLRVPHGLLDSLCEGRSELVLVDECRHQAGELEVAAGAHRHIVVEAALVVPRRDLLLVFHREHVGSGRIDADAHPDDKFVPASLSDPVERLRRETHAVLERPAPGVVPAVAEPRPEVLEERVVGGHDFATVETRLLRSSRSLGEAFDELLDLRVGHRMAAVLVVHRGQARRRPVGLIREIEVAMRADVVELLNHHRAVFVAGVRYPAKVRDHAVVVVAEVAPGEHRGAVDRHRLDHDHGRPAHGPLQVIAEMAFGGEAFGAHVGGVGAEVQAMLERLRADLYGAEQVREWRCGRHGAIVLATVDVSGR